MRKRVACLKTRTFIYQVIVSKEEVLIVSVPRVSGERMVHVIRSRGESVSSNYFNAVCEDEGLTVGDVIAIALVLGIYIPPQIANDLTGGYSLIAKIAESLGVEF